MYGMIKPIDAMGSINDGMQMRDMIDTRSQKKASNKFDMAVKNAQFGAQILGAAKNQQEWDSGLKQLQEYGMDASKLPGEFTPENQRNLVDSAMTVGDRLQEQWKQKEFGLKERELGAKEKEAGAKKVGEAGKLATDLRKERTDLQTTRDTQKVSASYNRIQKAAKDPSAAGDLALIFNYMKMLDPGSTVREGEFATAQNSAGVPEQVRNMYDRIKSGHRLHPNQRQDFIGQAGGQYRAQLDLQNQADQTFVSLAERSGVNPKDVIVDFQANKVEAKPPTLSKDQLSGMSREEKIAEATKRGLLKTPNKQISGIMRGTPGEGG